jgi:hypothetical protein
MVIGAVVIFATACSGVPTPSSSSPSPSTSSPSPTQVNIVGCYGVWQGKNHYNLDIISVTGSHVVGRMTYDNYQFDSSQGEYVGEYSNNQLLGIYSFVAEGAFSRRDLIFKRVGGSFIEGFGDMQTIGNYDHLLDPSSVTWDSAFTFSPETTCPAVWK